MTSSEQLSKRLGVFSTYKYELYVLSLEESDVNDSYRHIFHKESNTDFEEKTKLKEIFENRLRWRPVDEIKENLDEAHYGPELNRLILDRIDNINPIVPKIVDPA